MKRRDWRRELRILSVPPILFLALIVYFGIISDGGDLAKNDFISVEGSRELPTVEVNSSGPESLFALDHYTDIVEKNVFSSSRKRPSVRYSPRGSSSTGTSVPGEYVLLGVMVSGGDHSTAIIRKGGKGGETKSYKVGDEVDNMHVEEIMYDRVILRQGEKETILELKPRDDEKLKRPKPKATPKRKPAKVRKREKSK